MQLVAGLTARPAPDLVAAAKKETAEAGRKAEAAVVQVTKIEAEVQHMAVSAQLLSSRWGMLQLCLQPGKRIGPAPQLWHSKNVTLFAVVLKGAGYLAVVSA